MLGVCNVNTCPPPALPPSLSIAIASGHSSSKITFIGVSSLCIEACSRQFYTTSVSSIRGVELLLSPYVLRSSRAHRSQQLVHDAVVALILYSFGSVRLVHVFSPYTTVQQHLVRTRSRVLCEQAIPVAYRRTRLPSRRSSGSRVTPKVAAW